jgi:hypothetical protein
VGVPLDDIHRLQSLVNLFAVNCLRPTVLLLTGPAGATSAYARHTVQAAERTVQGRGGEIRRFSARIVDEADVEEVMGKASNSRGTGGLFAFLQVSTLSKHTK